MNDKPKVEALLTVAETAEYLGLADGTVYHMISEGRLPVIRLSKRCVRFRLDDLDKWLEERTAPAH